MNFANVVIDDGVRWLGVTESLTRVILGLGKRARTMIALRNRRRVGLLPLLSLFLGYEQLAVVGGSSRDMLAHLRQRG